MKLPLVSKSSGPGQVAIALAQGLKGEEGKGMGAGPSPVSFSHLEKQLEAKQKAHEKSQ